MLRIERDCEDCTIRLKLSGRIQSGQIGLLRSAINDGAARKVLDLSEVTLVDVDVVRFLATCEEAGVGLIECPSYIREWMLRERSENGAARRFARHRTQQRTESMGEAMQPCAVRGARYYNSAGRKEPQ